MAKPKISAGLRKFLAAWLKWAENDSGDGSYDVFYRWRGLCSSASAWGISIEFKGLLRSYFPKTDHPFGGRIRYESDAFNNTMHKNPKRLAWVREMLKADAEGDGEASEEAPNKAANPAKRGTK